MDKASKIRMAFYAFKCDKVKVDLKKGQFFNAILLSRTDYDNGKSKEPLAVFETDFLLDFEVDEDFTFSRNKIFISFKNLEDLNMAKEGTEKYSDLSEIRKLCYWPLDLEKPIKSAAKKSLFQV